VSVTGECRTAVPGRNVHPHMYPAARKAGTTTDPVNRRHTSPPGRPTSATHSNVHTGQSVSNPSSQVWTTGCQPGHACHAPRAQASCRYRQPITPASHGLYQGESPRADPARFVSTACASTSRPAGMPPQHPINAGRDNTFPVSRSTHAIPIARANARAPSTQSPGRHLNAGTSHGQPSRPSRQIHGDSPRQRADPRPIWPHDRTPPAPGSSRDRPDAHAQHAPQHRNQGVVTTQASRGGQDTGRRGAL